LTETRSQTDRDLSSKSDEFVWDETGHSDAHRWLTPPVLSHLRRAGARTVLDLGCGNGSFTAMLREQGFEITGLDHSATGIALARKHYPKVRFDQHDLATPLPDALHGRFDAVVSTEVIEHLLLPRKLVANAWMALRPGGVLVLTMPYHGYWKNLTLALLDKFDDHWHPLRDFGHVKFFSRKTITALLQETGFGEIAVSTAGRIPPLACSMVVQAVKPR
jgi:2-polyprenyl-6-hydroxyphenyl methylase/3-demethylubiquinone-9 3-methyltransferase